MCYKQQDMINILETNLDDCTGEILGYVMERLLGIGAMDVFYTPIYMKKNRPAYKLTVLCKDENIEEIEDIIFLETTAIGIRKRKEERTILRRSIKEVETPFGVLKVKAVETPIGEKWYPEYEDAKKIANINNIPLKDVYKLI